MRPFVRGLRAFCGFSPRTKEDLKIDLRSGWPYSSTAITLQRPCDTPRTSTSPENDFRRARFGNIIFRTMNAAYPIFRADLEYDMRVAARADTRKNNRHPASKLNFRPRFALFHTLFSRFEMATAAARQKTSLVLGNLPPKQTGFGNAVVSFFRQFSISCLLRDWSTAQTALVRIVMHENEDGQSRK